MERKTTILIGVSIATFLATFDGAAVLMALPVLNREWESAGFHATQWVMTAFLLVMTSMLLASGRFGDVYGRARAWRTGIAVFAIASAACSWMPGLWWLVAARCVQGVGAALITANSAPLLMESYSKRWGQALGFGNLAIALGLVLGPPVGALLVHALSWRLIFALAVPTGILAWLTTRGKLPRESRPEKKSLDLVGSALAALALAGLLVGGTFAQSWGWTSKRALGFFGAGILATFAFALLEHRRRDPLLEIALFKDRTFISGALTEMLGYISLFSLTVAMPFFLLDVQKRSMLESGLLVGIVPLALSLVAPLAGRLFHRIGSRALCTPALVVVALALTLLSTISSKTGSLFLAVGLALAGAGFGAFQSPNVAEVLGSLQESRLGVSTATLGTMRNLGMTLGVSLAATLLGHRSMRSAMLAGAFVGVLAAAAAFLRPRKNSKKNGKEL